MMARLEHSGTQLAAIAYEQICLGVLFGLARIKDAEIPRAEPQAKRAVVPEFAQVPVLREESGA